MWESVALTLAGTAGNNIGKVLQKKGTLILPPLSLKLKVNPMTHPLPSPGSCRPRSQRDPYGVSCPCAQVVKAYASNQLWISGFLMDMCGAALMLTALSQAPVRCLLPLIPVRGDWVVYGPLLTVAQVSVVQPIAGCGLAILCVFSHFYLKEVMNGLDWIAITLAGLGTIDNRHSQICIFVVSSRHAYKPFIVSRRFHLTFYIIIIFKAPW